MQVASYHRIIILSFFQSSTPRFSGTSTNTLKVPLFVFFSVSQKKTKETATRLFLA